MLRLVRSMIVGLTVGLYPGLALSAEAFRDCAACPEMVVMPSGTFTMGAPASETVAVSQDERPMHRVTIPAPLAVGRYEVTFSEWNACVADGGCDGYRPKDLGWGRGDRPAISVSWIDAQTYVG